MEGRRRAGGRHGSDRRAGEERGVVDREEATRG